MAVRTRTEGGPAASVADAPVPPRDLPVVVAQLSLAVAAAAVTVAVVALARATESGQTITYVLCFLVFLPAVVAAGRPLQRALGGLPAPAAAILSAGAASGVLVVVLGARAAHAAGAAAAPVLIGGVTVWALASAAALRAVGSARGPSRGVISAGPRAVRVAWGVPTALAVAGTLAFVPDRLREPGALVVSVLVAAALMALVLGSERLRLPRWVGGALDAVAVALIVLAVIDASWILTLVPSHDSGLGLQLLHQGFYLGPVNDVLHGRAVLVDTFSQYGVGVVYFLAAVFTVAPLGYGPMGLLSSGLTGLACAAGYGSLRLAGCGRAVAAIALAAGIATTQLNLNGSTAGFPSVGALRFGPAYALILAVIARARWPARTRALRAVELTLVGISAVWSVEALVYALAIVGAVRAVEAASSPGLWRNHVRRWIVEVGWAVGAAVAAIALFELLTRIFAGQWPDWTPYLAFLNTYSSRTVPDVLVFPAISPWSSGFAVGSVYLASAVATARLTAVARTRPQLRRRLVATAALTAFGAGSLSYWITHGAPFALRWVALPAVLVGALWVDLVARARPSLPRAVRIGGLAFGAWVAALVVVFAWPQVDRTGERTALVHALPGPPSLHDDVGSLWHAPVVNPRALEGVRLLRRYAAGHGSVVVLTGGDLGLEILMRTHRQNALPLGHPLESDLIAGDVLPRVRAAVDRLAPGTLVLFEVANTPIPGYSDNALLRDTAALVQRRFLSHDVARTPGGLVLARLDGRRAPSS